MKHTKMIIAGLTTAITLSGAATVFADDTKAVEPVETRTRNFREMDIDMSGLDLPEGFIPFDEAHVPDGHNAPANGELKPIEFDEEGNMIFGQRPEEGMPPMMNGERPELPNGERPELPNGEMPEFAEGERPELPDGEMPQFPQNGFEQNGGQPGELNGGQPGGQPGEQNGGQFGSSYAQMAGMRF